MFPNFPLGPRPLITDGRKMVGRKSGNDRLDEYNLKQDTVVQEKESIIYTRGSQTYLYRWWVSFNNKLFSPVSFKSYYYTKVIGRSVVLFAFLNIVAKTLQTNKLTIRHFVSSRKCAKVLPVSYLNTIKLLVEVLFLSCEPLPWSL